MSQVLYRKYRSKALQEIVGQPHITQTIKNALAQGAISHAYLFTGPRGVGKTSIARILAHEVNNLPYTDDSNHLDIIEIDAASNRRIDEIRELRERVRTAPTSAKFKVYIIDEVHMLTKEAFNALLKTLEEPPAHVIFILATTEAHKLPETIISRTQRFTFKPVEKAEVIEHLRYIANQENITISDGALALIAEHGGGSFRDSISLLDQVSGHAAKIELENVQEVLGVAPQYVTDNLLEVMASGSPSELIVALQKSREAGYHASQLASQLARELRQQIVSGETGLSYQDTVTLLHKLLSVQSSSDPDAQLEVSMLDSILTKPEHTPVAAISVSVPYQNAVEQPAGPSPEKKNIKDEKTTIKNTNPVQEVNDKSVIETVVSSEEGSSLILDKDVWNKALNVIKNTHNTLYSVARMATPRISENELTLVFGFAFHQKRLNDAKNKQVIADVLENVLGKPVSINCIVEVETKTKPAQAAAVENPPTTITAPDTLATISNIFGGAEVLES